MMTCDTHMHSYHSFVGDPGMTFSNIAHHAAAAGIDVVAITDHLMKPGDIADLQRTRTELLAFRANRTSPVFLFGAEVCEVAADGSTLLTRQLAEALDFEVIIGGVHETHMPRGASLNEMALVQHRHQLMMMENPLIDILVHPWWLDRAEFERLSIPWPDSMSFIPEAMTAELARASRRTGTYIEISTMSGLCNGDASPRFRQDLLHYYRILNREGALFAIGTDAHAPKDIATYPQAADLIQTAGISTDRLWQPGKHSIHRNGDAQ